ncbi:hypothetical protein SynRCC2555_02532 [Synechococcus sp. WH 8101]|nr:hypothetical protein SynRCC2555_02532 [Synechococcus sp. WH 8101]
MSVKSMTASQTAYLQSGIFVSERQQVIMRISDLRKPWIQA